jgi:cation diffusion facilitator CzcD-associated flavoprotein CzcO
MFARAFVRAGLSRPFLRRASNRVGISRSVHAGMASGDETRVAIVGGGVAGIACAQSLVANGFGNRVDIYDQGSRGPGGRTSSSRPVEVNGETMAFDHGAQFFTANDPKFKVRAHSPSPPEP